MLLNWDSEAEEVCRRIESRRSTIKILIKAKDENELLPKWVAHHEAIVGTSGLVIFDNDSSDPDVVAYLETLSSRMVVAQFSGHHNHIHRLKRFRRLYQAMRNSCDWFAVLDADEFLHLLDEEGRPVRRSSLDSWLRERDGKDAIVGVWLSDVMERPSRYTLFSGKGAWPAGLTGGKSLISANVQPHGTLCHNFQLDGVDLRNVGAGVVIRHDRYEPPARRIRVNIQKLRQHRILRNACGIEEALAIDRDNVAHPGARKWLKEIEVLRNHQRPVEYPVKGLDLGEVAFDTDGGIQFACSGDRDKYRAYAHAPGRALRRALVGTIEQLASPWVLANADNLSMSVDEERSVARARSRMSDMASTVRVPERPFMPPLEAGFLEEALGTSSCFLEYGSGGSTRLAARLRVPRIYSVESDLAFAEAVREAVRADGWALAHTMLAVDIGAKPNNWGRPASTDKCRRWPRYVLGIWEKIDSEGHSPDLILVDGRFRVAAALSSISRARVGARVLFDDFANRQQRYGGIRSILQPERFVGRMAVFVVPEALDWRRLTFLLARSCVDPS